MCEVGESFFVAKGTMVASRSDTKRRKRDSSPLHSNPKRTKVHAQRKFAQGVSSLSNLLNLTPVKEKSDKSRSNGTAGNSTNDPKSTESTGSPSDVTTPGKRALPARGAKKPSIEDMITFLCYRGTSALPPHLAHLNKAPSPEPASSLKASENSRNKVGDRNNKDSDKNIKKSLKTASTAQKAVTAAQALKRKYQEQRIKKTTVSTLSSKVKPTPLLRSTRSSAGAVACSSTKGTPKKIDLKKNNATSPSRKRDSSVKDDSSSKKSSRLSVNKHQTNNSRTPISSPHASGSRGGLRSGGLSLEKSLRNSVKSLGGVKKKKKKLSPDKEDASQDSKKLATSLSDFSSEDDQPLVKKHKPLVQVQKLIKKSIANIGRKMRMEPRRSTRGVSLGQLSPSSSPPKRLSSGSLQSQGPKDEQRVSKKASIPTTSKEQNGVARRSTSNENQKKEAPLTPKSASTKMKKGYVMELVHDVDDVDPPPETRSRRGSRDLREQSTDEKSNISSEISKAQGPSNKKKDAAKTMEQSKKLASSAALSKASNAKPAAALKNQVEVTLSAALKSPPDLRIPPSIKRPLTAVGITNPMAIAAAAAVVFKPSSTKPEEKVKGREPPQKKEDVKKKEVVSSQTNSKIKLVKQEEKMSQSKSKEGDKKSPDDSKKEIKVGQLRVTSPRRKADESSDEGTKATSSVTLKECKGTRLKIESDSGKEVVTEDDAKILRMSKKNTVKAHTDEDEETLGAKSSLKKNSDEDEHKLSSRSRRSANRSLKKPHSSDEEVTNVAQGIPGDGSKNARVKASSTENDSEVDTASKQKTKKGNVCEVKSQSSDEDVSRKKSSKCVKKVLRSYNEVSSENDSDANLSDAADLSNSKPSTRSSARAKTGKRSSLRFTRSGNKSPAHDKRHNLKSDTSEDESETEKPSRVHKTRSKTVKSSSNKESNSESSEDEVDKNSSKPHGRNQRNVSSATRKNNKAARLVGSSSDSASSTDDDDDDDFEDVTSKSKRKTKATDSDSKSTSIRKSKDRRNRLKNLSDDDIDCDKKESKGRQSRSPRRSSRRSTKASIIDDKNDDLSVSDASSSESSPSQNRRVLRQRRGFFSFAEVDPPSDSEEEVLAATKASLEMINNHQQQTVDATSNEKEDKDSTSNSQETQSKGKSAKSNSSEPVKSSKKTKPDAPPVRKSLSKKRVKPPSEVQSNLNEELEKTLLSINLSPQMSKTVDKSPEQLSSTSMDTVVVQAPRSAVRGLEMPSEPSSSLSPKISTSIPSTHPSSTVVGSPKKPAGPVDPLGTAASLPPLSSAAMPLTRAPGAKMTSTKSGPTSKSQKSSAFIVSATSAPVSSISTASGVTSAHAMTVSQPTPKGSLTSCSVMPAVGSGSMSTVSTLSAGPVISSVIGMPSVSMSASTSLIGAPLTAPMSAPLPTAMSAQMPSSIAVSIPPSSVSSSLSAPMALPMSAPMSIPLATQLGIPLQTSVPLNVPMSGTMTLHSSGTSGSPFLLPVQSMASMLAPGQTIIKKESGTVAGMSNPMGNASPLMVGMNPLVVNSNRGAFFLSTGSTMTMTASQQQMVPGPLMPSLLSLRLPDKPAGQQTIMASSPLYVPFAFGNSGIIQTQGQMQPQIQMTGVSTITAMATNIQNSANMQGSVATNIHNTVAANIQSSMTSNIQNPMATNVPNMSAMNIQTPAPASIQNSSSVSSAMTLSQAQGTGIGMKRQLVLATKNGPVSKLILSVGEDGSHVLAAANPNTLPTTSEAQTLMSMMQPIKPPVSTVNVVACQGVQTLPSASSKPSTIAPKLSSVMPKVVQPMTSSTSAVQKQQFVLSSNVAVSSAASGINLSSGIQISSSVNASPIRTLPIPSSTSMPVVKCGALYATSIGGSPDAITSTSVPLLSSSSTASTVTKSSVAPGPTSLPDSTKISAANSSGSRVSTGILNTGVKSDVRLTPTNASIRPAVSISTISSSSSLKPEEKPRAPPGMVPNSSADPKMIKTPLEPNAMSITSSKFPSPVKVASTAAQSRNIGKTIDVKPVAQPSVSSVTPPMVTSRIPSAHAALAALKSPSGAQSSSRAIAKTGSSRKPYSSAGSFAASKPSDPAEAASVIPTVSSSPSREASSIDSSSLPSISVRTTSSLVTPNVTISSKGTAVKPSSVPLPYSKNPSSPAVSGTSEQKRKGTEVELAPTHRTLSMLSTAFQGMGKERKRDVSKRTSTSAETSGLSENPGNIEKSGLDSLAEVATSLAERSVDTSMSCDKRTPQHSLWANPAQILGKETLRVPGLPITANVGANLPTKNDLAKMKSGAVLADAVEKRTDLEKNTKMKNNPIGADCEKPSVSGLLTSSKADTPRQKVQKWLDDGSKGDVEHKANCSLLSNGNTCTCDVVEEDISNLNSLAEVCINMERINSPAKDLKGPKPGVKLAPEKKGKQDLLEASKKSPSNESSPVKPTHPLNSHQMKVTWQNAFGVKSPARSSKPAVPPQPKRPVSSEDLKTVSTSVSELPEKNKKSSNDQKLQKSPVSQSSEQSAKNDKSSAADDGRKSQQRRSLLNKVAEQANSKLDSNAFSAVNESSVYAFEAETDTPPINRPFRRRSKASSRSDEEDSVSLGSTTHPNTVHVSKDPVIVPIQVEMDENISPMSQLTSEKNGIQSDASPNDGSDVYYIPLGGQEGNDGDVRAVAVRLGKEGPNNTVVMSAKIVKKPPTFKHPNDTNDDGLPNKRVKSETSQLPAHSVEAEASTSNIQPGPTNESRPIQEKSKPKLGETSRSSAADSSSEDTSSLINMPTYSKDTRDCRNSMSPASSRNRSPVSDKISPSASQNSKKGQGRLNRQSSIDSDASEKTKFMRRGSKSKSASSRASPSPSLPSTSSTSSGPSRPSQKSNRSYNGPVPGNVSEAPVFHPTEKEFQDPYEYIEKIRPIAEKYGLCRIVAPNSFKPDCNVEDDIRFTADNQYVHKMMDRWGPNAKEMRAIVKYIAQHNIHLQHAPLVGGMELDLPRLYTTVQNFGGLAEVMDKKRWVKVAETMRIPKSAQDRASKLDEVYCKCLLPYETLKTGERDNLFEMVEVEWEMRKERRDKRLAESAALTDQSESASQQDEDDDDDDEDEEDEEEDECIVKGRSMPLTTFFRTARNTIHMWFKSGSPSAAEVEHEFWRHVRDRNFHICVNSGSVDCSDPPYGFPTRNSPFAKHPWNLKVFSNSSGSILRSLGSVIGVTVPTLHFGMVFTTCCWYRDPHGLPWMEYLHTGAKKIWYGIPEHGAEKFRSAMQDVAPHYVRKKALWLASDTAMVPPSLLTERKVPLCRTVQEPGQFIVVFPRAHTSSVATGYIVSESVSYAPPSWLPTAMSSFKEMQQCNEPPLFSLDKLIFSIAEDSRSSRDVLNLILPSVMEILEREITFYAELKKKGVNSTERLERFKKKSSGKKGKVQKEAEDTEVMECEVCSTNLYLSMVLNNEDGSGYCLVHASLYLDQDKLDPGQCKLLYAYTQNDLHEFCQNLLDRIESKSGKKGNNVSSNNSDSESSASTSTRT
ncbi:mucin-16 isoform X2 [Thrips palmi]|uniref:Mucin-16 isoform X2 n=1 Tax=Thrips palmi TaxID=161013 RepID=A0A6P9A9K0_THRPL|nr:mucin-16 isoform X2 [Thrips palmi]